MGRRRQTVLEHRPVNGASFLCTFQVGLTGCAVARAFWGEWRAAKNEDHIIIRMKDRSWKLAEGSFLAWPLLAVGRQSPLVYYTWKKKRGGMASGISDFGMVEAEN